MTISEAPTVRDAGVGESTPKRPSLAPLRSESTRDRVVNAIRDAIIHGRLRPGEKVPEEDLAKQLGISRTPIREAIRILEQQGLVRVEPKKGTYIAKPNRSDEANALTVRVALEELAIRQAIERSTADQWAALCEALEGLLDEMTNAVELNDPVRAVELDIEFHAMLVAASRNRYLLKSWHLVGVPFLIWSPERESYPELRQDLNDGVAERHRELMDAIRSKSPGACARAVRRHISRKLAELPV
jgi:DNA-binding GntR family transcriptional regulator